MCEILKLQHQVEKLHFELHILQGGQTETFRAQCEGTKGKQAQHP